MASMMMAKPLARPVRQIGRRVVVCRADHQFSTQKLALPVATALASVMLTGAFFPEEAVAAKSGGRAGGSSGFSSRRSQPSSPASTSRTTIVNNTTVVAAPPVYGGYGYGGGFSFMPAFYMPIPLGGLGSIFGIFFLMAMLSVVFNVVRSMADSSSNNSSSTKKNNSWDD